MKAYSIYRKSAFLACLTFYLVILAGGVVRMTGSGMGCPDWPKCFGQYIPPTSADQIPSNYKDIYAEKRRVKNEKLGNYLSALGFQKLSTRITTDESMYVEQDFNVAKTYTEYINRLIGAVSGLFVLGAFASSLFLLRKRIRYFLLAFALLIIVGFQAWLGSIVVSTNLLPGMITTHMIFAFILIGLSMYMARNKESTLTFGISQEAQYLLLFGLFAILLQVVLGTQVREEIDVFKNVTGLDRSLWIEELGGLYTVHKVSSFFVAGIVLFLFAILRKEGFKSKFLILLPAGVGVMMISGIVMNFFSVPALMQPIHLLGSSVLFGVLMYTLLITKKKTFVKESQAAIMTP